MRRMAACKAVENGGVPGFPGRAPGPGGRGRAILPLIAEREFGLVSKSVILSFIVGFGFVKAFTNLAAGRFSDRIGRKWLLVGGWIVGLPLPFILMWAPSWGWITVANFLLG